MHERGSGTYKRVEPPGTSAQREGREKSTDNKMLSIYERNEWLFDTTRLRPS